MHPPNAIVSTSAAVIPDSQLVVDEVARGEGLSLAQLAKRLPAARGGGSATGSALWRWAIHGKRAPDGRTVRLGICRIGCRTISTEGALRRFLLDLQPPPAAAEPPPGLQTGRQATRARRQSGGAM